MRLHAVALALPFERPRLTAVDARISLQQSDFGGEDVGDALIAALERRRAVREQKYIATEITPPEPTPGKHKPRPPVIDGAAVQHECDMAAESGGNPGVSNGYADYKLRYAGQSATTGAGEWEPAAARRLFDGHYARADRFGYDARDERPDSLGAAVGRFADSPPVLRTRRGQAALNPSLGKQIRRFFG
jgi:hypothetical protein